MKWMFMQSERNRILEYLYHHKQINQTLGKLQPSELREDAKQDLFLTLSMLPEEKFMNIHNTTNKAGESGLVWWSIRTLCIMMKSDRSTFAKLYRAKCVEYADAFDQRLDESSYNSDTDTMIDIMKSEMLTFHWYESTVLAESVKLGSVLKLSRETGIPYRSLYKVIKKTKSELREKISTRFHE